jgi:hypothetical protein
MVHEEITIGFGVLFKDRSSDKTFVILDPENAIGKNWFQASQVVIDEGQERLGMPGTYIVQDMGEILGKWGIDRIKQGFRNSGWGDVGDPIIDELSQLPDRKVKNNSPSNFTPKLIFWGFKEFYKPLPIGLKYLPFFWQETPVKSPTSKRVFLVFKKHLLQRRIIQICSETLRLIGPDCNHTMAPYPKFA